MEGEGKGKCEIPERGFLIRGWPMRSVGSLRRATLCAGRAVGSGSCRQRSPRRGPRGRPDGVLLTRPEEMFVWFDGERRLAMGGLMR